jgi:hypothetical protein
MRYPKHLRGNLELLVDYIMLVLPSKCLFRIMILVAHDGYCPIHDDGGQSD